jgi:quercetin dioxygenase-like cupin family protein
MDMLNSDWPIGTFSVETLAAPDMVDHVTATMDPLWYDRPYTLTGVDIGAGWADCPQSAAARTHASLKCKTRTMNPATELPQNVTTRTLPMDIQRNGLKPSTKGPADWFTGTVRIDPLFQAPSPARVAGASVTFEPGARTAWHTHPLGQALIITAGCGWAQAEGGAVEVIRAGDIIWFAPDERHWHGATASTGMTHIAIAPALNGKVVTWLDHVTDAQYLAGAQGE